MTLNTQPVFEIDLTKIVANYKLLQKIAQNSTAAAVVKDDSYGLGAEIIAPYLYQNAGCRNFFVAHAVEGQKIARLLPDARIFVLQGIGEDNLEIFKQCPNLVPVISSPQALEFWENHRPNAQKPVIHLETGLNRLGFRENELQALSLEQRNQFSMVMSHLACGDEKDHFMNEYQLQTFKRLKQTYFPDLPASLSASDGVFLGADFQQDMVRLGAAMYGINTAPYRENQMQNVVRLTAPVLQVEKLPIGQFVGYSATYRANSERKIAIISIGYGDGVPRSLSNVGKVFFKNNGTLAEGRLIGRVSMDNIICDVTNVPDLKVGDTAYLLDDFYTLDDMGRDAGTISYEIVSRLGKNTRFKRIYKK